ncbi:hypothetical protein [Aridibaculum aurantiacum]|uniref:hypothetical protein n=1 Tax=Aridibaculum aurantiacum TaxID=2810307 RepID=UPI001A959C61|nr:hypothetical protein [Aridibaculum aurantiacum]
MKKILAHTTLFILILSAFASCRYKVQDLMARPSASFTVTPISNQVNRYVLTSNSTNGFRYDWDKATGNYVQGNATDTVYFPDKGTYLVKLLVYGQGGMDSTSQVINVAADDPAAITPLKLLTNNSSRTWKLASEANALWIGPSDFSATWWGNGVGDITGRSCQWNDEYTFKLAGRELVYDSKGDFYVDEENGAAWPAGMPAAGCYPNSAIPAQYQAWANSATFTFEIINNNKLKLNGTGAHMGVYKAGNPPDAALAAPASSVTYDIVSITANRLVLKLDYGWGAWRFTYTAQ